ncbi:hypothetical protein BDF14DRAFT_1749698 [Spinellus fusiger]|nr:hypothetical protein BDF14DRAFT_1749698 [Spinellus fusiger]
MIRMYSPSSLVTAQDDTSDEENGPTHIYVKQIIEKGVTDSGRIRYAVAWSDSTVTKETPAFLRKRTPELVEEFEHQESEHLLRLAIQT